MDVSIIIPAFNAEKTIENCVESLLKQNFNENFEVIVVDDGSTDSTLAIAEKFKKVKTMKQDNKGPAAARNAGAKKASGKIIAFIDADCVAEKNWLAEIVKPFKNKKVVGVQGSYKTLQKELMAKFVQIEIEQRYELMKKSKNLDWIGSYSAAYRKEIFLKEGGFDESFPIASGEDPELSFKLSKKGYKMTFNPKAIVYHLHPTSILKYLKMKFFRAYWRVLVYKKHKDKMIKDSYTPQSIKLQMFLIPLLVLTVVVNFFSPVFWDLLILEILALLLSFMPLTLFAFKRDIAVGIIAPLIQFLRSFSFFLGFALGTLNSWRSAK